MNVMKKLSYYSGILILTFGFSLMTSLSYSQELKLSRQELKEAKKAALYANFQAIDTLLQRKAFVLEADYLQDYYGNLIPVTSTLNFIKVNGEKAVWQTGSNYYMGYNGVGGVTAEGDLNNWKISKDLKHMSYTITFGVTTDIGQYDVLLMISADNTARATITGLTNGRLTYQGNIVALYNSRVFKGQRTL